MSKSAADRDCATFEDLNELLQSIEDNLTAKKSQIVFLRGYPSPEWLSALGTVFWIDPEFFKLRLRFRNSTEYFSSPCLPSSLEDIIRLRLITIGSRIEKRGTSRSAAVESLRSEGRKALRTYAHELIVKTGVRRGDSIVRDYHVLDEKTFILEQEVYICLSKVGKSWAGEMLKSC